MCSAPCMVATEAHDVCVIGVDMKVSTKDNLSEVSVELHSITVRQAQRAAPRAVNRTLSTFRAQLTRDLRAEITLKARDIRELIHIRKAYAGNPSGSMTVSFKGVPSNRYQHRMGARGVSLRVKKAGKAKVLRRTFGPAKGGKHPRRAVLHGNIYRRTREKSVPIKGYWVRWARKSAKRKVPKREVIERLYSPALVTQAAPFIRKLRDSGWLAAELEKNYRRNISFASSRKK